MITEHIIFISIRKNHQELGYDPAKIQFLIINKQKK
jgi:hypothetical protein